MYAIQGVGTTVDELRRRIIGGAADRAAFQARWFEWVGEFDELEGWTFDGLASLAAWLSHYCGLDGRTARQHAQVARSLRSLPAIAGAFGRGELSFSKVRAVCRAATGDNEELLLELATTLTAAQLERVVTSYVRQRERPITMRKEEERRARSGVTTWVDGDGLHHTEIMSAPEDGLVIDAALDDGRRQLWAEQKKPVKRRQGNLDSLLLVLRRGLINAARSDVDGGIHLLITHVPDAGALVRDDGQVELANGSVVHVRVLQRLGCEALLQAMITDGETGRPLDLGRETRNVTIKQKRALMAAHPRCSWHGCRVMSKHCEFHHLDWWSQGGGTDLENIRPLCARHHRMVHDGGWKAVVGFDGQLVLIPPDGRPALHAVPPVRARRGDEVVVANRAAGPGLEPGAGASAGAGVGASIRGTAGGERMTEWMVATYLDGLVAIDERVARAAPMSPN